MPLSFGIQLPPWNFLPSEDHFPYRLVGEVGLDHLTVPVVTGERGQFRLARGFATPWFHTEGGWHYPPQAERYLGCDLRPPVARWCGKRDTLAPLRAFADESHLALYCRLDLLDGRPWLSHVPDWTLRNAWGEPVPPAGPCPFHPAFRELVAATLADLRRYEPAGFVLAADRWTASPLWQARPNPIEISQYLPFGPAARQVLRRAGLDVEAVRQAVDALLEACRTARVPRRYLNGSDQDADGVPELVSAACGALRADLLAWLADLASGPEQFFLEFPAEQPPVALLPQGWEARLSCPLSRLDDPGAEAWLTRWRSETDCPALVAAFDPDHASGADQCVRGVMRVVHHQLRFVEFAEVESAPEEAVTWLRQAVRYARREADG